MRSLVLRIANADAQASVNVELALVNSQGQRTLDFATLQATAAALVDESNVALKYEDSDGDLVTIGSDADLREVVEFMDEEGKDRLDVVVKTSSSIVKQHFLGLVAAVTKLANTMDISGSAAAKPKPTVEDVIDLLRVAVSSWNLAEDTEELASIKADLLKLLNDNDLCNAVVELSLTDSYRELAESLLGALHAGQPVETVVTSQWEAAVGFTKEILVQCPESKENLIRLAKACVSCIALLNQELCTANKMPSLIQVAELDEGKPLPSTASAKGGSDVALVHEHYRCDGCDTAPIVGVRYRSTRDANFDLCNSCHSSGGYDAEYAPFNEFAHFQPIHFNVSCDGCQQSPISGVRYKALMVNDFDLCEACEASGKWSSHEPFIKIKHPDQVPRHIEVHIEPPVEVPQVHPFVTCDGCEMSPLVGRRFKSSSVDDFDLCESCHGSGVWKESHGPFEVVDAMSNFRGFKKWWKREKKAHKFYSKAVCQGFGCGMFMPPPGVPHPHPHPHPHPKPDDYHHPDHHGRHRHGHHGHHGRHDRHGRHGHHGHYRHHLHGLEGGASVCDVQTEYAAVFLQDVTIPDGTVVAPDVALVKSWKMKNGGTSAWPEGCVLKMQTGRCGVAPFEGKPDVVNARVPPLAPGEEFVAEVQLQTPSEPGRYTAYWRMCDPNGNAFGHRFWTDVVVSEALGIDEDGIIVHTTTPDNAFVTSVTVAPADSEEDDVEVVELIVSDHESGMDIASHVSTDDDSFSASLVSSDSDTDSATSDDEDENAFDGVSDEEVEVDAAPAQETEAGQRRGSVTLDQENIEVNDVVGELYEDALGMLEAMGFGDREQNRATLAQWGGNLADTVNSLLMDA